ncbi:MAG TPA: hypothetical protein VE973_03200 [Candidatus Limnocylindria bacterium]|nr:hypothetical protein [Candidatus Limnocylindria bacterium]
MSQNIKKNSIGFLLVEVLLALMLFSILVMVVVEVLLSGQEAARTGGLRAQATFLAEEGQEAVRNIRDSSYLNLADGTYGLSITNSQWQLSGSPDQTGIFTRQVNVSSPMPNVKEINVTVTWQQTATREGTTTLDSYLTNWHGN